MNLNVQIKKSPLPKDDPTRRKPNIEFAKKLLNWEPLIQLDKGLDLTIEYFKNIT